MKLTILLGMLVLFIGNSLPFNALGDTLSEKMLACQQLSNSSERLSCFDALTQSKNTALDTKNSQQQVLSEDRTVTTEQAVDKQTKASTSQGTKALTAEQLENRFGQENKNIEEKTLDELSTQVISVDKHPYGYHRIGMANGHVWKLTEVSSTRFKIGDTVIVKRGVFTGFFLKKEGSNRTVRVKRIE